MRKFIITFIMALGLIGMSACTPTGSVSPATQDAGKSLDAALNKALGNEESDVKVVPWGQNTTHAFTSTGVRMKSKDGTTKVKTKDESIVTQSSVLAETHGASLLVNPQDTRSIKSALDGTKDQWKGSKYVIVVSQGKHVHGVYRADKRPNVHEQDDMSNISFEDGDNRFTIVEAGFDYMIVKTNSL